MYERIWFKLGLMISRKQKVSAPFISQIFQWIQMEFGMLLRLVCGLMSLILTLSHLISIQGTELNLANFVIKKTLTFGFHSDIFRSISFKLCIVTDTAILYCLMPVGMILTFIQGHSCKRKQKLLLSFSRKFLNWFGWNVVSCHDLFTCSSSCWILFTGVIFQRENSALVILYRTCWLCYHILMGRFGMLINMIKIYLLIWVWITRRATD